MLEKILNELGKSKTPCLFIINFDKSDFYIRALNELDDDLLFEIEKTPKVHHKPIHYLSSFTTLYPKQ